MGKSVQGILIKDEKVLVVQGISDNGIKNNCFISGDVLETESELEAIKREIKEQLGLETDITFMFSKDLVSDVKTFLIDIGNKDINLNYEMKDIKCISKNYKAASLDWVDISDITAFKEFETQHFRLLLEECIKNDYNESWTEIIKENYFISHMSKSQLNKVYMQSNRDKIDSNENLNNKLIAILLALGIGILFDYFFIWDSIGISGFIFSSAIILSSIYINKKHINLKRSLGFVFLIPIILLSISFSIYNNIILNVLNVILIPFLIVSYIITIRYENIKEINFSFIENIIDRVFNKCFSALPKFFTFSNEIVKSRKKVKENSIKKNIIRGLLISIPLLVIIILLLTSADMMFKYYVENIGDLFGEFNTMSLIGHTFIIAIVTLYMFGLLWSFKYNEINTNNKNFLVKSTWEPVTIITIIFVINIAYLLFTIVQFSYLYGGGINLLPEGFSYAEYARKGFFELILVTLINFVILLLSINFTKKDNKVINKIANISYSLLILFTFNMLFSANYKMYLYEKAFGFTRLRIFVQAFMILVGVILLIFLLGVWIKRIKIFKYALIATLIVYIGLNFINVDKLIAKNNIIRYEETKKIDIEYIKLLSYDAAPEIIKLLEVDDIYIRNQIDSHLINKKDALNKHYNHWYEFNYHKSKFLKLVNLK